MNNKKWKLNPGTSIGPLEFGMDRANVRRALGEKYKPFRKSIFSKSTSDSYGSFHVYYSKENRLVAIEFYEGVEILIDGKVVFPGNLATAETVIKGIEDKSGSMISKEMSIGITLSDDDNIEAFLAGCKGYYD